MEDTIIGLYEIIKDRKSNTVPDSYTCYLFEKGTDKILKKCAEECGETIIAAKNASNKETVEEISDLLFHLLVLMVNEGIELSDVISELERRRQKQGNLKTFNKVDKNT
ncbi:MAG: phosphoribosyl-ATP diphosphatase [Oscillospiraceae bacterium]|jgi:phosphoribosyl-ATP pyrophosphohydrolase|nr:phosphoribosyl-ATP diphosphatase [Oscillospiraceae bacterium]